MSDAKAKAEARRQKILARSASKELSVSAIAVDESDETYAAISEIKGKERPLAARRSFITEKSTSKLEESTTGDDSTKTESEKEKPTDKGKEEASDKSARDKDTNVEADSEKKEKTEATPPTSPQNSSSAIKYGKVKSYEEINEEVARQTAASDAKIRGDKPVDDEVVAAVPSSSSTKLKASKKAQKSSGNNEEDTATGSSSGSKLSDKEAAKLLKSKNNSNGGAAVESHHWLRFLRLLLICCFAIYTGYRTAETARMEAIQVNSVSSDSSGLGLEFATFEGGNKLIMDMVEFGGAASSSIPANADGNGNKASSTTATATTGRTWVGYFQQMLISRMECSVSAVMLIYWLAGILNRSSLFSAKKPESNKAKESLVSWFMSEGLTRMMQEWIEAAYSVMGEVSLHLTVLTLTVLLHSLYFMHIAYSQTAVASSGVTGEETASEVMAASTAAIIGGEL